MFKNLQTKWNVTGSRLVLILITFAFGGSLTGYFGKKIMHLSGIENAAVYVPVYIIVVTLIWPLMVLLVSIPFGQASFFIAYLKKMFSKLMSTKNVTISAVQKQNSAATNPNLSEINLAVFASGAGSNAQQIINYFKGHAHIKIALVVCNKPGAGVLQIAAAEGITTLLIEKEQFFNGTAYLPQLKENRISFIVLAGFLWKIPQTLINAFPKRIINIHPALLPQYGGKGMYGAHVHTAVIQNGEKESGITIHYVDEQYDNGAIIFQARCPVLSNDVPQSLAQRIHHLEHAYFSKVIEETVQKTFS